MVERAVEESYLAAARRLVTSPARQRATRRQRCTSAHGVFAQECVGWVVVHQGRGPLALHLMTLISLSRAVSCTWAAPLTNAWVLAFPVNVPRISFFSFASVTVISYRALCHVLGWLDPGDLVWLTVLSRVWGTSLVKTQCDYASCVWPSRSSSLHCTSQLGSLSRTLATVTLICTNDRG